ncbi:MAG: class I tRNA ligase family protein, partial [Candidatus Anstonellales archaeon]
PVEILMSKQWFAKLMDHKKGIEKVAREIKWYPDFGIYYLLDWLNTLEWDWVISRQRYWGTPLPFYYCESCNETQAAEEHELPFYPEKASNKTCKKCKGKMIPEQATADVWIDSSITPLIIAGWPEKGWEKLYPSDLRPQGIEIVRTWAFYTVYRCYMLTGKRPFKAILLNGNVLGPDGRKMSKSLGNVIDPMQLVDQYSADAARLWVALSGNLEKDKPFNYQQIKRAHSLVVKLWNAARFILMHADAENIKHIMEKNMKLEPIDMAIIEKLKMTSQKINNSMESFDYYNAITALTDFFWLDFCDTYIEIVKKRLKENKNKEEALYTLSYVFQNIIKLYAPFAPFITEELYRNAFANEGSIHKKHYPYFDSYNYAYVHYFDMMKKALSMIRKKTKEIQDKGKINLEIHKNREKNEILIILNGEEEHISVDNEILNEIEKNGLIEKAKHELNYLIK